MGSIFVINGNEFIDIHKTELLELWDKSQRGERITKIL